MGLETLSYAAFSHPPIFYCEKCGLAGTEEMGWRDAYEVKALQQLFLVMCLARVGLP